MQAGLSSKRGGGRKKTARGGVWFRKTGHDHKLQGIRRGELGKSRESLEEGSVRGDLVKTRPGKDSRKTRLNGKEAVSLPWKKHGEGISLHQNLSCEKEE